MSFKNRYIKFAVTVIAQKYEPVQTLFFFCCCKQVLANQFILGLPPLDIFGNESALLSRTSLQMNSQGVNANDFLIIEQFGMISPIFKALYKEKNFLQLEFVDGTPCDLDNVNRSTIVELYCGAVNAITSLREDSTCKYRIKVEMSILCSLPRFAPPKENVSRNSPLIIL